ncbi:cytochrome P450 [Penicillium angulare]|uniref:Cytochrome P450 n=1 Tax=Penicillium angulare TaxID=116970 RepID=A0A9W9FB84_9EURO|nr:cytochrome P450 [Penicillium angulare]
MHADFMKVISRDFVNETTATAILDRGNIGARISTLISFTEDPAEQNLWERSTNMKVLAKEDQGRHSAVEVDLERLLKRFTFCLGVPLLYGHDYLERNSLVLEDWELFSKQAVPLLAIGIPSWIPIKSFQQGLKARDRLHESLVSVYRRVKQHFNDEPVEYSADMSDVSKSTLERFDVFDRHGVSINGIGQIELSLLWAQNHNAQQLLFWFIFYIYSVPGLLESLRNEVLSSGAIATSSDNSPQVTKLDISTLTRECVLLKSSFLETFRLTEESILFRNVTQKVTMDDGEKQHELSSGSWISISNCLTKHHPSLYPEPHEFKPCRFIEDSKEGGKRIVSYKALRPWGIGAGMCKGRTFAEKELLAVAASMITIWDIEPMDGLWKHPGFQAGATILGSGGNVRVRMKRRDADSI